MTTLALIAIASIFVISAVRSSYYILWFLAGISFWGLGVWLISHPFVAGSSPINDIMVVICFLGGIALMFGMSWRTNKDGNGGFNFRIPKVFGGQSEEEENQSRNIRTSADRRADYNERISRALGGKR